MICFRGGSWAGYPVFLFFCFSRSFSVFLGFFCFRFAEVRGLDILYFCFSVFLEAFLFFSFLFCFRLVYLSFCMYNRTNTYNNIQTHKQLRDKHKQQTQHKYIISQPEPDKYLFAVGSKAGYLVFLFLFKSVSFVKRYTIIDVTC